MSYCGLVDVRISASRQRFTCTEGHNSASRRATQTLTTMAEKITVTIEKKVMDIEFVKAWITSDYDYLDAIHTRSMSSKKRY